MKSDLLPRLRIFVIAGCAFAGCATGAFAQSPSLSGSPDQSPHAWRKADASPIPSPNSAPAQENVQAQTANDASVPVQQGPPAPDPADQINAPAPEPQEPQSPQPAPQGAPAPFPQSAPAPVQQENGQFPQQQQQSPYPPQAQQSPYPAQAQQSPYPPQAQQSPYPPQYQPPYSPGAGYGNSTIPAVLTIAPGTYVTVRVSGWLSSDRNQTGDAFTATLAEPIIVNGVVIARRGQTVGGVVTEAKKAGRVEGTSTLGLRLTDLTLADGQKATLQTSMVVRNGDTSVGRDAAAIGGTTALGAAVGAAADWGRGAAIGAGAGAAAGILGVLLTRGRPTVVYPETALTFRLDAPVDIDTTHAPQAFRYADESDYGRPAYSQPPPRMAGPCYGCTSPSPYYPPAYAPYYAPYPWYWGSGFSLYVGPRLYYYPRSYAGGYWYRRR